MRKSILAATMAIALGACSHGQNHHPESNGARHPFAQSHHKPHINSVASNGDFDVTLTRLKEAIERRGFRTFAVIDHAKGAASIDADLRPTTLVIFGNPRGGTPLMQAEQRLGLRLPLKFLVIEDASGGVQIIYPDMAHLFHEYSVEGMAAPLGNIERALAAMAAEAADMED